MVTWSLLPFAVNAMLNLSIIITFFGGGREGGSGPGMGWGGAHFPRACSLYSEFYGVLINKDNNTGVEGAAGIEPATNHVAWENL